MSSRIVQPLSESAMQIAEQRFPALAAKAGHKAYKTALRQTGAVVVKTSDGKIVERRSDGTTTVIKQISVGTRVKSGTIFRRFK